jgi:hypothetical protein
MCVEALEPRVSRLSLMGSIAHRWVRVCRGEVGGAGSCRAEVRIIWADLHVLPTNEEELLRHILMQEHHDNSGDLRSHTQEHARDS